jgi:AmmeMemoRadiSam system protein B/AmmeMemoRadiSam system protein A
MRRAFTLPAVAAVVWLACLVFATGGGSSSNSSEREPSMKIRKPAVSGMFYPGTQPALERAVATSLKSAEKKEFRSPIRAIFAPHAGYVYCGDTMAAAFKQIEGPEFIYDRVLMIGPSHRVRTKAAAVSSAEVWETPLGPVPVDTEFARKFVEKSDRIEFNDAAHAGEHSLEVQLPYLVLAAQGKSFRIVPILTNSPDPKDHETVARCLTELASDPKTLIVVSSDLSHYPAGDTAKKVDRQILEAVCSLNHDTLSTVDRNLMSKGYAGLDCTMCGLEATLCLERAARNIGISEATVVDYSNSGMKAGDPNRVVGYGAVVFSGPSENAMKKKQSPTGISFSKETKRELIALAKSAINAAVKGEQVPNSPVDNPELQIKAGCFVTLKATGKLRGCIGCFQSDAPLWKTVRHMAVSSATRDSRFSNSPIVPDEVPNLHIEISVLSPLQEVANPLQQIRLGRDGIAIRDRGRSGTFLPQVATETGWTVEEFLGHCARDKAGLGWNGWKSPTAAVYTYTATIVDEDDLSAAPAGK